MAGAGNDGNVGNAISAGVDGNAGEAGRDGGGSDLMVGRSRPCVCPMYR